MWDPLYGSYPSSPFQSASLNTSPRRFSSSPVDRSATSLPTATLHSQRQLRSPFSPHSQPAEPPSSISEHNAYIPPPPNSSSVVVFGFPMSQTKMIEDRFSQYGHLQSSIIKGNTLYLEYIEPIAAERAIREDGRWIFSGHLTFLIAVKYLDYIDLYPENSASLTFGGNFQRKSADKLDRIKQDNFAVRTYNTLFSGW